MINIPRTAVNGEVIRTSIREAREHAAAMGDQQKRRTEESTIEKPAQER